MKTITLENGKVMTPLEEIDKYIEKSGVPNDPHWAYCFVLPELTTLYDMAMHGELLNALGYAFDLGQAKGYKMAKNEQQRIKGK